MNDTPDSRECFGADLSPEAVAALGRYRDLLLEANRRFNLTAITDSDEVDRRLIAESLALLPLIPPGASTLLDIGSGGGIPGLPLAIARPELRVTLLDATAKKVRFLEETAATLGLDNVQTLWGRAEELARDQRQREHYDVATARAVARLATLAEYVLPFLRVGGVAILPKGSGAGDELAEAEYAITRLGGSARPLEAGGVVVIDKVAATAAEYPRRAGQPAKSPLAAAGKRPRRTV